ncbi:Uma2 family endonuclease [Tautonia plasticadhaerens]|uniref:Putative restriction endonuclease domain-containing protein n=1 Tax=Tautonia plasticadhaerens TaxID=2527974 RepID=A0A518HAS0_9BACT|nr:Uma2 family endonuclease [Tautonia plasticadhaerens]QDV37907.1 hypothetical protein ElP_58540 [Tautonia plasticadhaerens]
MATPRPQADTPPPAARPPGMPPAQRLFGVPYGAYLQIRDDPRNDGLRLTYYDGVLELMSPEYQHELGADLIGQVVRAAAEAMDLPYRSSRCTTFRRGRPTRARGKGKEPDHSFYFANEARIRGKRTLDLEVDPPPDLWIEVDNRGSSRGRFPVYADFGVPEVWQYRPRAHRLAFFRLDRDRAAYDEIGRSLSLPCLTPDLVLLALDHAPNASELEWLRWLRGWAEQLPNP